MALAKLWNAVFGKRPAAEPAPPAQPVAGSVASVVAPARSPSERKTVTLTATLAASAAVVKTAMPAVNATSKATATSNPAAPVEAAVVKLSKHKTKAKAKKSKASEVEAIAVAPEPISVLRMFRRKNNAWTKLIGSRTVNVILDMNVQDGSRAVELLEAIVDSNSASPKYVAIGMFELAGERLTVRQFHQKVRAAGGQPVVIPMPLVEGLRRLSQTVGTADLILLDIADQQIADPVVARLLQRITSPNALVLRRDAKDRWQSVASPSRAA